MSNGNGVTAAESVEAEGRLPRWAGYLPDRFVAGMQFLAPFVITYLVVKFLVDIAASVLEPLFIDWFGYQIPVGLAVGIILLAPLLFGAVEIHFFGVRALAAFEAAVIRVPVIGPVFGVAHQLVSSFGGASETGFRRVVQIEYPRPGLWTIGFLTDTFTYEDGTEMGVVYIATAPTPNSGWLALVPLEEVRSIDVTVGQAMQMIVSAGIASPEMITRRPLAGPMEGAG